MGDDRLGQQVKMREKMDVRVGSKRRIIGGGQNTKKGQEMGRRNKRWIEKKRNSGKTNNLQLSSSLLFLQAAGCINT